MVCPGQARQDRRPHLGLAAGAARTTGHQLRCGGGNRSGAKNPQAAGFLFDGFPRTIAQAEALDKFLAGKNQKITATVALEANDEILVQRLLERGKTSGRPDDQDEEKIRNRYQEYNEKTAPLMDFYKAQHKFYAVDGIGSIEEVTERLSLVLDTFK